MFDPNVIEDSALDEAIASAFSDLKAHSADEEGYRDSVDQLTKLYKLKNEAQQLNVQAQREYAAHQLAESQHQLAIDQHTLACDQNAWQEEQDEVPFYQRVDPNTAVTVLGNLVVALIVVRYEKTGVISSQFAKFMRKL